MPKSRRVYFVDNALVRNVWLARVAVAAPHRRALAAISGRTRTMRQFMGERPTEKKLATDSHGSNTDCLAATRSLLSGA